ncbi:hypothetical protein F0U61_31390 [Archangium violaceum]|uniref:hypothetical protein n=1 Tax=Archangium violaceum TaxID=83451 RepID=UPI002B3034E8|nr:hypothetical protein F0U61_31390 [Archangium violaceum]
MDLSLWPVVLMLGLPLLALFVVLIWLFSRLLSVTTLYAHVHANPVEGWRVPVLVRADNPSKVILDARFERLTREGLVQPSAVEYR